MGVRTASTMTTSRPVDVMRRSLRAVDWRVSQYPAPAPGAARHRRERHDRARPGGRRGPPRAGDPVRALGALGRPRARDWLDADAVEVTCDRGGARRRPVRGRGDRRGPRREDRAVRRAGRHPRPPARSSPPRPRRCRPRRWRRAAGAPSASPRCTSSTRSRRWRWSSSRSPPRRAPRRAPARSRSARRSARPRSRSPDTPGFVVNRLLFPYLFDAVELLERTGMDAGGGRHVHEARRRPPARPAGAARPRRPRRRRRRSARTIGVAVPARVDALVAEGALGRKSGRGFHTYDAVNAIF